MNKYEFGNDFIWGVATSAYQIEGAWNEDGKGESIWDRFTHTKSKNPFKERIYQNQNGDVACDHYHRYKEDLNLMKELSIPNYRFSLSWTRIFPDGKLTSKNQKGIDFYHKLIDACLERNITPNVTIYHWDLPQALEDEGGWTNRDTYLKFLDYVDFVTKEYKDKVPSQWGENLKGVKTRLSTDKKVLALTFDATGIERDKGYDEELINYLIENKIPATLFLSGLWIDKNPEILKELSKVEFFEIANLGANHLPCSLNGKEVYGIKGTRNVEEIISEIEDNALKIAEYTGKKPKYYRAGTVYTDEYCPEIAEKLGYEIVGFSVLGDAGATYSKEKVKNALLNAQPGDIVILHMNIPKSETYEGLKEAIPLLKEKGFEFVKLSDYPLQ